ncbi:MAG: GGDEF domain-containing protein [Sneathiella sp.]
MLWFSAHLTAALRENFSGYSNMWKSAFDDPEEALPRHTSPNSIPDRSIDFTQSVLNALKEQISVIDRTGAILYVNDSWDQFATTNNCRQGTNWAGSNYLYICKQAAASGDDYGRKAFHGISAVIDGEYLDYSMEYPCHSPTERRWFMMTVTRLGLRGAEYFIICHRDITARKLSEEQAQQLARTDELTALPNRRSFSEFLENEWQRSVRAKQPISLALVDLDNFKTLNDVFGHQQGDIHLEKIGEQLQSHMHRASDFCARLGGDEFALVMGNTPKDKAELVLDRILQCVQMFDINTDSDTSSYRFSASMGLITCYPDQTTSIEETIGQADELLYVAKGEGGNQIMSADTRHPSELPDRPLGISRKPLQILDTPD